MPEDAQAATHMRAEIEQIPDAVEGLLRSDPAPLEAAAAAFRRARPRLVRIVARGTSDHAALYARYLVEVQLGIPVSLVAPAVTTVYRAGWRSHGGVLIAISQSGQGQDVVAISREARERGAVTIGITNDPRAALARVSDHLLLCRAGPEQAVPATKTYTLTLAVIAMLVARIGRDAELSAGIEALPGVLREGLAAASAWIERERGDERAVGRFAAADRALVVSRGYNLATAMEIALKLKESAGILAEGYAAPDLLHGPIVLAGTKLPMLVFRPDGRMGRFVDDAIDAAVGRGALPYLVGGAEVARRSRALSLESALPEALTPMLFALPGQLLSEAVARRRGLNPDSPEGLRKVTRTR